MDSKEVEEHSWVKNKHRTLNGGQKRTLLGGPKEKEARQVCREVMKAFSGNLLRPLELVPASRELVVPTKWQVRTVLGDGISKAKVVCPAAHFNFFGTAFDPRVWTMVVFWKEDSAPADYT